LTSYNGFYAECYDIIYAEKPYQQEASFIDQLLREYSHAPHSSLLDVACGTGRHAFEFEKLGYTVTAIDLSSDLLSQAIKKAPIFGSKVRFEKADMRSFDLRGQKFGVVTCLFDSIGYVHTNTAVTETFRGIHHHLADNGVFVLEYWHAPAMLKSYEPCRVRRWSIPSGNLVRVSESSLDVAKQLCHVAYTLYEFRPDGTYSTHAETQSNRFFLAEEMNLLLTASGFRVIKQLAAYDRSAEISEKTWHVLAVAEKA